MKAYHARTKDVGGIPVARLLPQRGKRTIGPWCFLDHAGPATFTEHEVGMQVGAHPHTNLATFTWMLAGEVLHRDSLGHEQLIRCGEVNVMCAGTGDNAGISHTEETPTGIDRLHAVQLWFALPMQQQIAPSFEHHEDLPTWYEQGVDVTLLIGDYCGKTAPTRAYSSIIGLDLAFREEHGRFVAPLQKGFEYGVLVTTGEISYNGTCYGENTLLAFDQVISSDSETLTLEAKAGTRVMLLGGAPLGHPVYMWWNFVADSDQAIQKAITDWNNGHSRFGDIRVGDKTLARMPSPVLRTTLHVNHH